MKLGSLFDGSGGFPLAGSRCGIEPVWASEVEPYPIAVTKSRFPGMKHLGSVTDINGADVEPMDIITFGSPCQDLSVAGKRAGLKHEANGDEETTRSGLFMEAVRIIKEMREATNGEYPTFAVWENVPGAFSSNQGEDFRIVCEELIKIVEPTAVMPAVPKGGWAYADSYIGDGWSLAYRVFDAQYWGVPQRRRRIHLVLDLRGERARKILFERKGLRGHFTESRAAWQTVAGDAENCTGTADRGGAVRLTSAGFKGNQGAKAGSTGFAEETACTLSANCPGLEPTVCIKEQYLFENNSQDTRYKNSLDVSPALPAQLGTGGNNTPFVVEKDTPIYCLQGNDIDRSDTAGCNGKGWKEDVGYTLNTIDRPAVAYLASGKKAVGTLMANAGTKLWLGNQEAFSGGYHIIEESDPVSVRYIVRRLTPTECARLQGFADRWGDINRKDDFTEEEYRFWCNVVLTKALIDGTVVQNEDGELYFKSRMKPYKHKTKEQLLTWYNKLHTDSAEYKMWGNGIAIPCALYVMEGIADAGY